MELLELLLVKEIVPPKSTPAGHWFLFSMKRMIGSWPLANRVENNPTMKINRDCLHCITLPILYPRFFAKVIPEADFVAVGDVPNHPIKGYVCIFWEQCHFTQKLLILKT
jgi:hypothetical protein